MIVSISIANLFHIEYYVSILFIVCLIFQLSGGEHDYINVNGNKTAASMIAERSEEDVCDKAAAASANKTKSEVYSNNSNNTRILTQQSSLIAPNEVLVSVSPALTAEPVLTPNGKLKSYPIAALVKNFN